MPKRLWKPVKQTTNKHAAADSKGKIETVCVCQFLDIKSMLSLGCASKGLQRVAKLSGSRRVKHILTKYKVDRREVNFRQVQGWQNQLRYLTTRPLKVQELQEFKRKDGDHGCGPIQIVEFKADILPNGKIAMVCDHFLAVVDPIAGTITSMLDRPDERRGVYFSNSLSYTSGYLVMDAPPTMVPGAQDGLHIWVGSKDLDSFAYKGFTPFPQSVFPMRNKHFLLDRDSTVLYSSKYIGSTIVVTRFDFITSETTQTTVDLKDYGIMLAAVPLWQLGFNLLLVGEYFLVANSHQPEMETDVVNVPMFACTFRRSDLGMVDFLKAQQGIHFMADCPNAVNADYLLFQMRRKDYTQQFRCKKVRVDGEGRISISDYILANNVRPTLTNPRFEMLTQRVAIVSATMYIPNSCFAAECDAVTGKRIRKLIPIYDWFLHGPRQLFLSDPERETLMTFTKSKESLFLLTFTLKSEEHFVEEDFESKVDEAV